FEDLIGPNLRCWSMAWRVKNADGQTFAGWHQDSAYGAPIPVVLGALALSDCGPTQGCLRGIPGSHRWGVLRHEESDDPKSILARGQYIVEEFDESRAVDFALAPGEMAMFDNSLIHGSATNFGPDRRFLLLVEMVPTWAKPAKFRQPAMLVRGEDTSGNFEDERRPAAEPADDGELRKVDRDLVEVPRVAEVVRPVGRVVHRAIDADGNLQLRGLRVERIEAPIARGDPVHQRRDPERVEPLLPHAVL